MKRFLFPLFAFIVLFLTHATTAQATELIRSFDSQITVNQDTSLTIKETIEYETDSEKHGIYRYIPYRYDRGDGWNYRARVFDVTVTDEKGRAHTFEQSFDSGNISLKIGDADVTFSGPMTYVIEYKVENALQERDGVQSLVWDITGEGWQIPIAQTQATITSPFADIETVDCFSGEFGSDDGLCTTLSQASNAVTFSYTQLITYGDNMTIEVVATQPNQLLFPTPTQRALRAIRDNIGLFFLPLPGLGMFFWWWNKGRDSVFISPNVFVNDPAQPQTKSSLFGRRAPFVYEPLKDVTPGEAGVMLDEKADNQDVVAEILELAHKKYLKITQEEKKKLFGKETDFVFTELKAADAKLPEVQHYLQTQLFSGRKSVKLSTLKGTFYTNMDTAKSMLTKTLTDRSLFNGNPSHRRMLGLGAAIATLSLGFVALVQLLEMGVYWGLPIYAVSAGVALICGWSMPTKTAVGSNLSFQAKGLKETIMRGAWREKIKEKNLFIEQVLPFAVSLGVVDQLTKDMEKLNIKPPEYVSSGMAQNMAMASFMSSFSEQAASGMSYNPSSSSSSGGGSSGGGGGGGGGGSW